MTDADLLDALRDCYAFPGGPNIVTAGLVLSAHLTPDPDAPGAGIPGVPPRFIASITLRAPSSDAAATAQLQAQVANRLAGVASIVSTVMHLRPPLFTIV